MLPSASPCECRQRLSAPGLAFFGHIIRCSRAISNSFLSSYSWLSRVLTKHPEESWSFFGGVRHLGDGGGEPVLGSNQSRNVTKLYYQTLGLFFIFIF